MIQDLTQIPSPQDIDKELAFRHFHEYVPQAWRVLEPNTKFLNNWHIRLICEYLEAVKNGDIKRLIVNIPPRFMKSVLITVMWPSWLWINDPSLRFIFGSYSLSLSLKHSLDRRNLIQSQWYQSNWGDRVTLSDDQNQKSEFQNTKTGYMFATSVGGTVTGRGAKVIILDDPLNPEEAFSDTMRDTCNRWIDQTLSTRLDDKKNGAIVLVMHRLHEKDATGHLLNKVNDTGDPDWTVLSLPAVAPKTTVLTYPMSKIEQVREVDDVLWPERETLEMLQVQQRAMGSYAYAGQYQQEPAPLGGGLIKEAWWRFYDPAMFDLQKIEQWIQSWDLNVVETKKGSFMVGQVWGRVGAQIFLIDQIRKRVDFPDAVKAIMAMSLKWPLTGAKLIENKANGPAVISTLSSKIGGIIAMDPKTGKETRTAGISYLIEAGNVYIPNQEQVSWVREFLAECSKFPNYGTDDQVDTMTQALDYLSFFVLNSNGAEQLAVFGGKPRLLSNQEQFTEDFGIYSNISEFGRTNYSDMDIW